MPPTPSSIKRQELSYQPWGIILWADSAHLTSTLLPGSRYFPQVEVVLRMTAMRLPRNS
jgi:hypothetical protein